MLSLVGRERETEMFYLMTHSTHFIYGYMASDIWLRTILIMKKETCCRHIGYSYWLTARVLLYAPSHRQDNTYKGLCYPSCGALAGTRNSSMGPPHEGSIRRPIAPWANALPLSYVPLHWWEGVYVMVSVYRNVFSFATTTATQLLCAEICFVQSNRFRQKIIHWSEGWFECQNSGNYLQHDVWCHQKNAI